MSLLAALLVGCGTTSTVPITGRKQTLLVTDGEVLSLSTQQYKQYMQSAKPSTNATNTAMVKRVGQNLANAVSTYLTNNGMSAELQNYAWEFNLVQDNQVNAWCMPGGKIVVYEGILPITQDEASLAIVLGHEIAHAVAKHSAERLSNEYKNQYGTAILGAVVQGAGVSEKTQALISLGQQLGGALWTSGFSRKQESDSSSQPWPATILRWPQPSGSAWPHRALVVAVCSLTTPPTRSASRIFRVGCPRP